MLVNTKSDLGGCAKVHNERLQAQYQASEEKQRYRYEQEFYEYVRTIVLDLDRKIKRGRERLDLKPIDAVIEGGEQQEERIVLLEVKIKELTEKVN